MVTLKETTDAEVRVWVATTKLGPYGVLGDMISAEYNPSTTLGGIVARGWGTIRVRWDTDDDWGYEILWAALSGLHPELWLRFASKDDVQQLRVTVTGISMEHPEDGSSEGSISFTAEA